MYKELKNIMELKDLKTIDVQMKRLIFTLAFAAVAFSSHAQRKQSFDNGWKFFRGSAINTELMDYDDSKWREVTVPHDFSMEPVAYTHDYRERTEGWEDWQVGPFSRLSVGDSDNGQTVGGEGWYRKTFTLDGSASIDELLSRKNLTLRFDGVYNQSEVWVNGKKAASNVYGYMPFTVNLNQVLCDKTNRNPHDERRVTVAVKSINQGLNCRWYAGSGIFRHVWLETTGKLHLDEWDTYVDASRLSQGSGKVMVNARIFGDKTDGTIKVDIHDAAGKVVSSAEKSLSPNGADGNRMGADDLLSVALTVKSPKLWSVDTPYRYTARVSLCNAQGETDAITIPFGIRTIEFSAKEGFKLNGKMLNLRGGCVHHDNGLLGGAAIDRAEVRKVELLKAQGYNAVRTSHNLPSVAFFNACDSLGVLVIDECFDQWEEPKRKDDYSNYFTQNFEKDAALMVRRDRNHPSVIMWSIGNEIAQRSDARGKEIAEAITRAIKREDATRPTTLAVNDYWDRTAQKYTWDKDSPRAFDLIEIGGYNYEQRRYEGDHAKFPDRIMYGSETYPNAIAANWQLVEKHPYVIGDFVWTAVDYIGEAGLGHALERSDRGRWIQLLAWPWFSAWCGDIDLAGVKKPQSYYRDVVWDERKIAMAVRPAVTDGEYEDALGWCWTAEENHWNWNDRAYYDKGRYLPVDIRPEKYQNATLQRDVVHDVNGHRSDSLRVNVYTKESRVRLSINGKVIGEQDVDGSNYTASFFVAYEPGELKAEIVSPSKPAVSKSSKSGKGKSSNMQNEVVFRTAKAPAAVMFEAVDSSVTSSHNDLAYVYIKVVDEDGNLCPTAEIPLEIKTAGVKHTVVAGTGHPYDMKSFRSLHPTTFRGQALAIIQPEGEKGDVAITVSSPKLKESATYSVHLR